ncbi:alpha-hydroxy-acid oxidizing protein [Cohnella caldifontis]|uniref:alpha-hydroxy-acid oxidizing protein n=1 Tax=Cohnella caldifontis TaxID=3027471 RepID=UPI0023EBB13D|nr:alpha-hydroxy-acid oxidizing protein [Cohnella sp. YIM B05605]
MNYGVRVQSARGAECASGRVPVVSYWEWERMARRKLPLFAFDYVAGGAGGESTIRANRRSFEQWKIVPRLMSGVSDRKLTVELFGRTYPFPIGLAPTASQGLFHGMGEVATAKAAAALGIPFILSTSSSYSIEEVASTGAPRWFQLYPGNDRDVMFSLVSRAEKAGYTAIVFTPDRPEIGWRERNIRNCLSTYIGPYASGNLRSDPVVRKKYGEPLASQAALALITNPGVTAADMQFVRSITRLPLLVKGVLHPEDAETSIRFGADGLIVSNHGGRHVDGAIAALEALPSVAMAVGSRVPVLFDSGIRHGADLFKALALGAKMAFIGRPYVYGLAVSGEIGVRTVAENLLADFDLNLGNSGIRYAAQLHKTHLVRSVCESP